MKSTRFNRHNSIVDAPTWRKQYADAMAQLHKQGSINEHSIRL